MMKRGISGTLDTIEIVIAAVASIVAAIRFIR